MKRFNITAFMAFLFLKSFAFDLSIDNIYYNLHPDNTAEVTYGYQKYSGEVHIPQNIQVDGVAYKVTSIGSGAFNDSPHLTSLYLSESIESIKDMGVANCPELSLIYLPSSIKRVDVSAFKATNQIIKIYTGCSFELKKYIFLYALPEINIIDGTTVIDSMAFAGSKIKQIAIPESVKAIKDKAFKNCSQLSSIELPHNILTIGKESFKGCNALTEVNIPQNAESVGEKAFACCANLRTLSIPLSTKYIGNNVIDSCLHLETLRAPVQVINKTSDQYAPTALKTLEIGAGILSNYKFINDICAHLENLDLCNINNSSFPDEFLNGAVSLKKLILPLQLSATGFRSFANCLSLESVAIPTTLSETGKGTFEGCIKLHNVIFGTKNKLIYVGNWTFRNCTNLTKIQLPWGVKIIGDGVFSGCSGLKNVILPTSCTELDDNIFTDCSSLISIECQATIPPKVNNNSFAGIDKNTTIFVPSKSVSNYQSAPGWKEFKNFRAIP